MRQVPLSPDTAAATTAGLVATATALPPLSYHHSQPWVHMSCFGVLLPEAQAQLEESDDPFFCAVCAAARPNLVPNPSCTTDSAPPTNSHEGEGTSRHLCQRPEGSQRVRAARSYGRTGGRRLRGPRAIQRNAREAQDTTAQSMPDDGKTAQMDEVIEAFEEGTGRSVIKNT